jgi:uncharacterized protein
MRYREQLVEVVRGQSWLMEALRAARSVALPEWAIAAGAIRNTVWDVLHGFEPPTALNDVDVLFYDPTLSVDEKATEAKLRQLVPTIEWESKNQASIHEWYKRKLDVEIEPYASVEAGIAGFVEVATAVGVRLEDDDSITVIAPFGLDDLFELRLTVNETSPDPWYFNTRLEAKGWTSHWPRLVVEDQPQPSS